MSNEFLPNYEDVLLPKDIQKILHLGRNSVYRFLADGTIRSVRLGGKYLIPKDNLKDFMYPDTTHKKRRREKMTIDNLLTEYNDVLRPEDLQHILKAGRNTIYDYLKKGIIRSLMIGGKYRIPKLYLLEYMYPDISFAKGA